MSDFLRGIRELIDGSDVRISEHGYDRLAEENISTTVGQQLSAEAITLKTRKKTKHVYEGQYVAEVEVELIGDESGWMPYLNIDDAYKLDDVREALRRLDLKSAAQYGRIYELHLVAVQ